MNLSQARKSCASKFQTYWKKVHKEMVKEFPDINWDEYILNNKLYCADWDNRRIAWEDTPLSSYYWDDPDKFYEVIESIQPKGWYIELINSCEGHLYEI